MRYIIGAFFCGIIGLTITLLVLDINSYNMSVAEHTPCSGVLVEADSFFSEVRCVEPAEVK